MTSAFSRFKRTPAIMSFVLVLLLRATPPTLAFTIPPVSNRNNVIPFKSKPCTTTSTHSWARTIITVNHIQKGLTNASTTNGRFLLQRMEMAKTHGKQENDTPPPPAAARHKQQILTIQQKTEVLLYRLALISASTGYACSLLSNALATSTLGGAGLSLETLHNIQDDSHYIFTWGFLIAALLAPPYLGAITDTNKQNDVNNALFLLLNELLPTLAGFGIIAEVLNQIQTVLDPPNSSSSSVIVPSSSYYANGGDSLENITLVFISLICLREIGFFGASYKAEAILAIFCAIAFGLNEWIGFSDVALSGGLALSMLVLSFGKMFEPWRDDLEPNQSAFFRDN